MPTNPTSVILIKFGIEQSYNLVGFCHHEITEENLNVLRNREETSKEEELELDAKFFVLDEASYLEFAKTASPDKLGWHDRTTWGEVRELDPAYADSTTETFDFVLSHGLWSLQEHAGFFTFEQKAHWDAATLFHDFVFDDEDGNHECNGTACCAWLEEWQE